MKPKRETGDPFLTVNPPLHRASTVLYETYESYLKADQKPYHGKLYGTYGSPVQLELERELAELEGGHACRVCHSGLDAIETVLMAFTRKGDHILVCDNVYGPTRDFGDRVLAKYGVEVEYLPPTVGSDLESTYSAVPQAPAPTAPSAISLRTVGIPAFEPLVAA